MGGLSTLTLCLAAALVIAVARIYGWRLFVPRGWSTGWGGSSGGDGGKQKGDVEAALEMGRAVSQRSIPSIVTSRLVDDPTPDETPTASQAGPSATEHKRHSLHSIDEGIMVSGQVAVAWGLCCWCSAVAARRACAAAHPNPRLPCPHPRR